MERPAMSDILESNLERLLRRTAPAPSAERVDASCRRFLDRLETAAPPRRRRPLLEVLTMTAALLLSAFIVWRIVAPPAPPPPGPAQDEDRAVDGLKLTMKLLTEETLPHKAAVSVEATFENVSTKAVTFHVPLMAEDFPSLVLTGAAGDYHPQPFLGGIMIRPGVQGSLVTLEPGEKKSFKIEETLFVAAKAGKVTGDPLPPGTYAARVRYSKQDDKVPYDDGPRKTAGLWTGSVESRSVRLVVGDPTGLEARLLTEPKSAILTVELSNHLKRDLDVRCTASLYGHCKYLGLTGTADITLENDGANLEAGKTFPLVLKKGERRTLRVDLAAITFTRQGRPTESFGLADIAGRDFYVTLKLHPAADPAIAPVEPNGLLILEIPSASGRDLSDRLKLELQPLRAPGCVSLKLSAVGKAAAINRRLAIFSDIRIEITDRKKGKDSIHYATRKSLPRPRAVTKADFGDLAPGADVTLEIDLNQLFVDGLPPGKYWVRAIYANEETGRRLGAETPALAGRASSGELELVVEK
jgi:hypothetical protein